MSDDATTRMAREVLPALELAGVDAMPVGGYAVHVVVVTQPAPGRDGELAAMFRITADLDLIVLAPNLEAACAVLTNMGFTPDPRHVRTPLRMLRRDTWVDLMLGGDAAELDGVAALDELTQLGLAERSPSGFPGVAVLSVLKAIAWRDRRLRRDLVDIGRLALFDAAHGSPTAAKFASVRQWSRPVREALVATRREFESIDGGGPSAFVSTRYARHFDDRSDEDDVRRRVRAAVLTLFGAFGIVDP